MSDKVKLIFAAVWLVFGVAAVIAGLDLIGWSGIIISNVYNAAVRF